MAAPIFPASLPVRRADRLFRLLFLLADGRITTAASLAASLEVSERTIYRDMADLLAAGAPIDGEAGVGYRLRKGFRLPPLMFDIDELQALLLGSRMVQGWSDPALGAAAQSALAKIRSVLPGALQGPAGGLELLVPDFHVPAAMVAPLGLLREAINANRKLSFAYVRADGEASRRTIWPLTLVYWGQTWTLGAWCELRSDFRSFRPDRMAGLIMEEETFDARQGALVRDFLRAVSAGGEGPP